MPERILYQFTLSPFAIKVRRILEYKKLPYRTIDINPLSRGEVVRLSGQKRVPVLVESRVDGAEGEDLREPPGDAVVAGAWTGSGADRPAIPGSGGGSTTSADGTIVVSDSTRIAEYLEARYPDSPIYPRDPAARARVTILEDWSDEKLARDLIAFKVFTPGNPRRMVEQSRRFYPSRWDYALLFRLGPFALRRAIASRRDGRTHAQLRSDYERDLDLLEALAADGAYLAGEGPTVFDFAVWGLLRTMEGLEGEELLSKRGHLAIWYASMKDL